MLLRLQLQLLAPPASRQAQNRVNSYRCALSEVKGHLDVFNGGHSRRTSTGREQEPNTTIMNRTLHRIARVSLDSSVSVEYPDWIKEDCEVTKMASIRKLQGGLKMIKHEHVASSTKEETEACQT